MTKVTTPTTDALLSGAQVAARLNVSARTVWSLRSSGLLKAIRLGPKLLRYRSEDIDALVASRYGQRHDDDLQAFLASRHSKNKP